MPLDLLRVNSFDQSGRAAQAASCLHQGLTQVGHTPKFLANYFVAPHIGDARFQDSLVAKALSRLSTGILHRRTTQDIRSLSPPTQVELAQRHVYAVFQLQPQVMNSFTERLPTLRPGTNKNLLPLVSTQLQFPHDFGSTPDLFHIAALMLNSNRAELIDSWHPNLPPSPSKLRILVSPLLLRMNPKPDFSPFTLFLQRNR